jgi:hypothetical protein
MYAECRHVLPAGLKCTAPRVGDSNFCYRHRNLHERMCAPAPRPGTPFRLPSLEDSHGCLIAIQEVAWAMGDKRISLKEAGMYFHAVNISKSLLPRRPAVTRKPVRTLCYDNDGFEMAEAVDACEPPRDCLTCPKTNTCEWFEYYEDQVEELEEQLAEEEEEKRQAEQGTQPESDTQNAQQPSKGKYDDELPNVRALLELIDRKAEAQQRAQQEEKARADKERAEQEKRETAQPEEEERTERERAQPEESTQQEEKEPAQPDERKPVEQEERERTQQELKIQPGKESLAGEPLANRLTG